MNFLRWGWPVSLSTAIFISKNKTKTLCAISFLNGVYQNINVKFWGAPAFPTFLLQFFFPITSEIVLKSGSEAVPLLSSPLQQYSGLLKILTPNSLPYLTLQVSSVL